MAQYQINVDSNILHPLFIGDSKDAGVAKLLESVLNQVLQAQVTEQLDAERYERAEERKGYRNGSYPHKLTTRVGTLTLHIHDDAGDGSWSQFNRKEEVLAFFIPTRRIRLGGPGYFTIGTIYSRPSFDHGGICILTFVSEKLQMKFYEIGDGAAKLLPVSFDEWESKAKSLLDAAPFGYVHGAAGAGDTNRSNVEAFQKYRIRPRVCCDITERDLSISLFGAKFPFPVLFAPIGVNTILHPDGELAPARAAAKLEVPYILSNVSSIPMETVAEAMGNCVRWFQRYPPKNHKLTRSFLERAEAAGYSAIVVTVDSTLLGWRETDLRNAYLPFLSGQGMGNYFTDPVFCSMLKEPPDQNKEAAVKLALDEGNNTCFTWKELDFIRQHTRLPILIKGITHPDDAVMALEHGVDGIIVSNHGGRQLDGAVATLDSLPAIGESVQGKVPVLLDSGIRRGADILKGIVLGADAVLIGRPYAYALAVAGESGVREVMERLIAETELQLAISGRSSIRDVDASLIIKVK